MLEFVKSEGVVLDSVVTRELLVSLFIPESVNKLHDGAVLIRDLKIARAGMFFPMPEAKILDASLGSRHRASLGITEETDAVVVVVSEERGTISFCFSGNIVSNLDGPSLRQALLGLFGRGTRKSRATRKTPQSIRPPSTSARVAPVVPPIKSPSLAAAQGAPTKLPTSTPMRPAEGLKVADAANAPTVTAEISAPSTATPIPMPSAGKTSSFVPSVPASGSDHGGLPGSGDDG